MVWQPKYETGNGLVDSQHKEIFRLVESVLESSYTSAANIKDAIDFLANYTITHFKHEESLMDESAYPLAHIHKRQHADFVADVVALMKMVDGENDDKINRTTIENVIINWLIDHVLGSDKILAAHYREWASNGS